MADADYSGRVRILVPLEGNLEDATVIANGGRSRDSRIHGLWEVHHTGVIQLSMLAPSMIQAVGSYINYPQQPTHNIRQGIQRGLTEKVSDYLRGCFVEVPNACFIEGTVMGATADTMFFRVRERSSLPASQSIAYAAERLGHHVLPVVNVNEPGTQQLTLEDFFTLLSKQAVYQLAPAEPASGMINIPAKRKETRAAAEFRTRVEELKEVQDWFKTSVYLMTQEVAGASVATGSSLPSTELVQTALQMIAGDLGLLRQVLHTGEMPPALRDKVQKRLAESAELAGDAAVIAGVTDLGETLREITGDNDASPGNPSGVSVSRRITRGGRGSK